MTTRTLWTGLAALLLASFAVLLWVGTQIHRQMPPLPENLNVCATALIQSHT